VESHKTAGNPTGLSSRLKRESRNIITAGLSGHQDFLISSMGGGGLSATKVIFRWLMILSTETYSMRKAMTFIVPPHRTPARG
jgi:hypothetical protein